MRDFKRLACCIESWKDQKTKENNWGLQNNLPTYCAFTLMNHFCPWKNEDPLFSFCISSFSFHLSLLFSFLSLLPSLSLFPLFLFLFGVHNIRLIRNWILTMLGLILNLFFSLSLLSFLSNVRLDKSGFHLIACSVHGAQWWRCLVALNPMHITSPP